MVDDLESKIYDLVCKHDGVYILKNKHKELTPETDLDTDLNFDEYEAEELLENFFAQFHVDRGKFCIKTYYPDTPTSFNPFRKKESIPVPHFTIGMLIESAKAKRWLYD